MWQRTLVKNSKYWDLTEQIFPDIVVFASRGVRQCSREHQGALFTVKRIREEVTFGRRSVWRDRSRVAVSDVHRTIVDMLDDAAKAAARSAIAM